MWKLLTVINGAGGCGFYQCYRVALVHESIAVLSNNSISVPSLRDRYIAEIRSKGRSEWKRQSGYYLQSHAENAFCSYKRIIGGRLRAKNEDAQKREAATCCAILNQMRDMGRPLSYAVG